MADNSELRYLTDEELLEKAKTIGAYNEDINNEWYSRFGINFPYRLTYNKRVFNCLSMQVMRDEQCDKLILEQVNEVRTLNNN